MIERALGETLSISVGTALPIERLLKEEKKMNIDFLYVNIRTIFRNLHSAIPVEDIDKYKPAELAEALHEELETIKNAVETKVLGNIGVILYVCSNKSLSKLMPHAKLKTATTDKQKNYEALERSTLENVINMPIGKKIKIYDCLVKGNNCNGLMITHFPLELLSYTTFRSLKLLESTTAAIKDRSEWNSKLTNPDSYGNLPFNLLTIQLIGDHSTQIMSGGVKMIKPLLEIAEKKKWSTSTTNAKVKFDIENHWDKLISKFYLEMLAVKLR